MPDVSRSIKLALLAILAVGPAGGSPLLSRAAERPNIVLCMADDLGWGDTGYNGHPHLKTPHLDQMAASGLRFDRFYAAAPVCSPTRGSCLTGRHPFRYGIFHANAGNANTPSKYVLPEREWTLAEALRAGGYTTGHFGKWHLGDFDGPMKSSPSDHGFDEWFSTTRKVPTVDPQGYWHNGKPARETLRGDDSRILMDRAIDFIRGAARAEQPLLAVIWFHTPHLPVLATPEHKALYAGRSEAEQNYWGAITAMDEQMGRLRGELRALGIAEDTLLWFASDNGPEGRAGQAPGSTGGLHGRKRDLLEGGVRVPGLLEWPAVIRQPRTSAVPCSTSDYLPTVVELLRIEPRGPQPLDGESLLPLVRGQDWQRMARLGFEFQTTSAWMDDRFKLLATTRPGSDELKGLKLFDLIHDPGEQRDLAAEQPERVQRMADALRAWRASCQKSLASQDPTAKRR